LIQGNVGEGVADVLQAVFGIATKHVDILDKTRK
jgi:hypothetical protein